MHRVDDPAATALDLCRDRRGGQLDPLSALQDDWIEDDGSLDEIGIARELAASLRAASTRRKGS